jgi:hypothetical protein
VRVTGGGVGSAVGASVGAAVADGEAAIALGVGSGPANALAGRCVYTPTSATAASATNMSFTG